MPTLTGNLSYVTGGTVPAAAVQSVTVRAPTPRAAGPAIVTTHVVDVAHDGTLTVDLEPGRATLTVDLAGGHSTFDLLVTPDTRTISEAATAALEHRNGG